MSDKEYNSQIASFRAPVERLAAHFKSWKIFHSDYRRPYSTYDDAFDADRGLFFFSITWVLNDPRGRPDRYRRPLQQLATRPPSKATQASMPDGPATLSRRPGPKDQRAAGIRPSRRAGSRQQYGLTPISSWYSPQPIPSAPTARNTSKVSPRRCYPPEYATV